MHAKKNKLSQLDRERLQRVIQQGEDRDTEKALESLKDEKSNIEAEIKKMESSLKTAEKLITRGTNADVIQLKKSLDTLSEQVVETNLNAGDPGGFSTLAFVENEKLLATVTGEEIGSLEILQKTNAS